RKLRVLIYVPSFGARSYDVECNVTGSPCRRAFQSSTLMRWRSAFWPSTAAVGAARLMGVTAATESTTNATVGRRRLFRSSSVVGRQPKRRHVSETDVAIAGT